MDKLKDLTDKLTGKNKYHSNLLGESLPDLLRKATAKTLVTPDESVNQQVVETIQQEVASGKDPREIVQLLKKRLRTDNPQKQWLGVLLFSKVMVDCSNVLGLYQEQLLQEVAKVMTRPARPETEAGKMARHAAKELLRRYGRAGNNAFRLAHQEVYGRQAGYPGMGGYQGHMVPGYPQAQGLDGGEAAAAHAEKQSLADEVALLIDKARSNTELLSDMLVNRNSGGGDEFEGELIRDLLAEVEELRSLFTAYLEQLQAQDGPEMEVLMVQALEAADTLDNCIALSKDVNSNQDIEVAAAAASPTASAHKAGPSTISNGSYSSYGSYGGAGTSGGPGTSAGGAPKASAAPPPKPMDDLIALDDLADGMLSPGGAAPAAAAYDPFAASATVPVLGGAAMLPAAAPGPAPPLGASPPAAAPAAAPPAGPQPTPAPMKSAFESMYLNNPSFSYLAGSPPKQAQPMQPPAPQAGAVQFAPYPPPPNTYPTHPAYGLAAAQPPPHQQLPGQGGYGQAGYGQQHPYGQPNPTTFTQPPTTTYGQQQPANPFSNYPPGPAAPSPYAMPASTAANYPVPITNMQPNYPTTSNNPFAPAGAGGTFAPALMQQQPQQPQPWGPGAGVSGGGAGVAHMPPSNNPFASSAPGAGHSTVDQEWNLFFADRTAGTASTQAR